MSTPDEHFTKQIAGSAGEQLQLRDQTVANLMRCFERIWIDFWNNVAAKSLEGVANAEMTSAYVKAPECPGIDELIICSCQD